MPERCVACTAARCWRALPAAPRTPLRCSSVLRASSRNSAISPVRRSNWRRTGERIAACGGSGGSYAQAAAHAFVQATDLPAREIVERSLLIAADICIYTNRNLTIEEL